APAVVHDLGPPERVARTGRAQVVDAEVDRLRNALAVRELDRLHERRQLEERADHAAVQRRQRDVPDQIVTERQHTHDALRIVLDPNAEEDRVGNQRQRLPSPHLPSSSRFRTACATGLTLLLAPIMNVPRALAKGSSGPCSHAVARTKATWVVSLWQCACPTSSRP